MSHISFHCPSLPTAYYFFIHILGAKETRHKLDRACGEEWVDFLHTDLMGTDQVSVHLSPDAKASEPIYAIEDIRGEARGKAALVQHLKAPSMRSAKVGTVQAPMPHWGPVLDIVGFERVLKQLRTIGCNADIITPALHHAGKAAEHQTLFLDLGMAIEIKGYADKSVITACL